MPDSENLYDGDTPQPAPSAESAPLTDWTTVKSGNSFEGDEDLLESTVAAAARSRIILVDQLSIAALTPDKRLICLTLIDSIDEAGYLRADLTEVAERLVIDVATVEETLRVLQGFDPVGVGARDLAECLALQLKAQDRSIRPSPRF